MSDFDSPLWLQDETYTAAEDRILIERVAVIEHVVDGFLVTPRAAGANYSVDVSQGHAYVAGDDSADQGMYLVRLKNDLNLAVGSPPATLTRIDRVVLQVNDPQAGGATGDPAEVVVIAGTPGAGMPSQPPSAITLASVSVAAGQASVTSANITDLRPRKGGNVTVSGVPPSPGDGVDGDVWITIA